VDSLGGDRPLQPELHPLPGLGRNGRRGGPDPAKAFLDDVKSFADPVVVVSGGEPLLREDVFDIIKYGTGLGLRMCMATNGSLVTDEVCGRLKEAGIKMVSLSLDGSTAEVHDNFRDQEGAFDGAVRAAGLFRKHGIPFLINSSFTKRNRRRYPRSTSLRKSWGRRPGTCS